MGLGNHTSPGSMLWPWAVEMSGTRKGTSLYPFALVATSCMRRTAFATVSLPGLQHLCCQYASRTPCRLFLPLAHLKTTSSSVMSTMAERWTRKKRTHPPAMSKRMLAKVLRVPPSRAKSRRGGMPSSRRTLACSVVWPGTLRRKSTTRELCRASSKPSQSDHHLRPAHACEAAVVPPLSTSMKNLPMRMSVG